MDMALIDIRTFPDPVLERIADPVAEFGPRLKKLVDDMRETLYAAPGVGLAAPQVGESIRLIVVDPTAGEKAGNFIAVANPVITEASGEITFEEGCLSVPGFNEEVDRYQKVTVTGQGLDGKDLRIDAEDFLAVIFQHEIDHLDGTLFIDHLSMLKRTLIKKKIRKNKAPPKKASRSAL